VNVADLIPSVRHQTAFDLYALNRIVDCAGCYCLTNAEGDILYIGQALSVRQRLIQHFDSDKRGTVTIHGRISLTWWRTEVAIKLAALERGWLETVRLRDGGFPPLNRIAAPI
jgi:excinuclease UvrABC nuclease subunit